MIAVLERNERQARRPRPKREYQPDRALDIAGGFEPMNGVSASLPGGLKAMGLKPRNGGRWHPSSVVNLLSSEVQTNLEACRRRARQLRTDEGLSLRAIGGKLEQEGYRPPRSAVRWHAATVSDLLQ